MTDPFERPARPLDLFNKHLGRVETEVAAQRLAVCGDCPMLKLGVCQECHCVMSLKTKLPNAECPLHKWGQVRVVEDAPSAIAVILDGIVVDVLRADERLTAIMLSNPTLVGIGSDSTIRVGDTYA
jgi:hypothetical protein